MVRFLSFAFALIALVVLGFDIWRGPLQEAPLALTLTAETWDAIHRPSLIGLNSYTENMLGPEVFDAVVLPLLSAPLFVVAGVLAALFYLLSRTFARSTRTDIYRPRPRRRR